MTIFSEIIESGEYEHYGIRAHRSEAIVGQSLGNSRIWVDGECTDEELDGISTIKVSEVDDIDAIVSKLRNEYCWENETIVLVGGYYGSHGEDAGEFIIRDNVCLAVL